MNAIRTPILLPEEAPLVDAAAESPASLRVALLVAVLTLASVPAIVFRDVVPRAATLYGLASWPNPYFVPEHAALLYGATPLVVLSSCVLLLAPGLLLALAAGAGARIERWFLAALAISLVVVSAVTAITQALVGLRVQEGTFLALVAGCSVAAAGVLALVASRRTLPWPARRDFLALLPLALGPLAIFLALEPKFLWEAFNGDGAHALETARLLLRQSLPFWDRAASNLASFPGLTSMTFAYPASWFVRLFGQLEVAARLPFLLAIAAVWAGVIELARAGRDWKPDQATRWLVWAGLLPFVLAMAYAATYSPYSADIAMPAAQDALLIAMFLAGAAALVEGRMGWFAAFAALTLLSLPNGLMLLALFLPATAVFLRPRNGRRVLLAAGMVAAMVLALALVPRLLGLLGLPQPGREYAGLSLLRYFAYLQWADWHRVAWIAVGCGIVPFLALFAWKLQDGVARALTATIAAYFLFFYFQGLTVVHHFSPAMVLPLVVCWRVAATLPALKRRRLMAGAAFAAVAATALAWPSDVRPYTAARDVGATIVDRVGGYQRGDPLAFQRGLLLRNVFPPDWDARMPGTTYGGPSVVFTYYAAHAEPGSTANYLIEPDTALPPLGWRRIASADGAALEVRSDAVMAAQLALRPAVDRGSPLFTLPRGMIFSSFPLPGGRIASTIDVLGRLGIDVRPLAKRLARPAAR